MKILITGASGFFGRELLHHIDSSNSEVHILSNIQEISHTNFINHKLNIHSQEETDSIMRLVKPSHLVHLAWYAKPPEFWHSKENLKWLDSSLYLFKSFISNGGSHAIVAGTCAEYGPETSNFYERNKDLSPQTLYGKTKLRLNEELFSLSKEYGVSLAWMRLFFPYGRGENPKKFLSSIVNNLIRNEIAVCNNSNLIRDYIHISDVARACIRLLEENFHGVVNIGTGQGSNLGNMAKSIAKNLCKENNLVLKNLDNSLKENAIIANVDVLRSLDWKPEISLDFGIQDLISSIK